MHTAQIVPLHRGFAEVSSFAELPEPTRPFNPPRSAAHIPLPLDAIPTLPEPRSYPPMPRAVPPRTAAQLKVCEAIKARYDQAERHRVALSSASASGYDRGLAAGYWRGGRHGLLLGLLAGVALAVVIVKLGAGL